jgi:two-component system nitrate/nitrite sensor histidine kinase NarX
MGRRSLLVRVGAAMAGIAVMAIASMLASIIIAQTAAGDAEAINKAGTLRMQAYRLADGIRSGAPSQRLDHYVERFATTLEDPAIVGMIPGHEADPLRQRFEALNQRWGNEMVPAIRGTRSEQQAYLQAVPGFVSDIDGLVGALENAAAERIRLLRFGQGVALFVTIALIFFTLYRLVTEVLPGIRELLTVVAAAQGGDLSRRTRYRGDDEIGALARTFNGMADNLQAMYQQLEARVADKTARLSQSNNALQLLYDAAQRTAAGGDDGVDWQPIVREIEDRLGTGTVALHLGAAGDRPPVRITRDEVMTDAPSSESPPPERTTKGNDGGLRVPITEAGQAYGVLDVASTGGALTDWQRQLVEAVADHIATARARRHREAERRRLALMEERSAIARELHDSLAQALSYLKIQTTRLEHELGAQRNGNAQSVIAELRDGLNNAYRQLRELLHTFRLQLGSGGARTALAEAVTEFGGRAQLPIDLRWEVPDGLLGPNQELHLVQIVREALANVVEHAGASLATVAVTGDSTEVIVTVTDNGSGPPARGRSDHHHGITIMRERARSIGGDLTIEPAPGAGTQVRLAFRPQTAPERPTQESST